MWAEIWLAANVSIQTFKAFGLADKAPDRLVWQECQQRYTVLLTANRNAEGPDSLEATIRDLNTAESLPVITLADADRVLRSRAYAERVAERVLDYLLNIEDHRGTGRIYVP